MKSETIVIDAGGRYGIHPTWKPFTGELRYYMFEPDSSEAKRLRDKYEKDPRIHVEAKALGDKSGNTTINILEHHGQSSLFSPNLNSNWFSKTRPGEGNTVSKQDVAITTLDEYCEKNNLQPDFLKSDTEGSELLVLNGAEKSLQSMIGVRTETQFEPVFFNAPTFADIFNHLTARGFILLNLDYAGKGAPCNKYFYGERFGVLTGTDAVWVRKPEQIISWGGNETEKAMVLAKYATFCFLNGASDLAMHSLLTAIQKQKVCLDLIGDTRLYSGLDITVQKLFYHLLQHPAYDRNELTSVYKQLFSKPLKRHHEFFGSIDFNPT